MFDLDLFLSPLAVLISVFLIGEVVAEEGRKVCRGKGEFTVPLSDESVQHHAC